VWDEHMNAIAILLHLRILHLDKPMYIILKVAPSTDTCSFVGSFSFSACICINDNEFAYSLIGRIYLAPSIVYVNSGHLTELAFICVYQFQLRPVKMYHSMLDNLKILSFYPVNQFGFKWISQKRLSLFA
jgi:hypothetical protein